MLEQSLAFFTEVFLTWFQPPSQPECPTSLPLLGGERKSKFRQQQKVAIFQNNPSTS